MLISVDKDSALKINLDQLERKIDELISGSATAYHHFHIELRAKSHNPCGRFFNTTQAERRQLDDFQAKMLRPYESGGSMHLLRKITRLARQSQDSCSFREVVDQVIDEEKTRTNDLLQTYKRIIDPLIARSKGETTPPLSPQESLFFRKQFGEFQAHYMRFNRLDTSMAREVIDLAIRYAGITVELGADLCHQKTSAPIPR